MNEHAVLFLGFVIYFTVFYAVGQVWGDTGRVCYTLATFGVVLFLGIYC